MKLQVDEEGWPGGGFLAEIEANAASPQTLANIAAQATVSRHLPSVLLARMHLAQLHYENDAAHPAHQEAMAALLLAQEIGDLVAEAQIRRLLALLAWDDGRSKDGHDHVIEAIAAYQELGKHTEVPVLLRWYGEHLGVLGALPEASEALLEAEKRFVAMGDESAARACAADRAAVKARSLSH